jgi:thioredoxin 1
MAILLKANEYDSEVLGSKIPVLVDFFGERCMPCRMMRPILLELNDEYAGQLKVCMFNTDREPQESEADYEEKFRVILQYNVMNLPTMLLFIEGQLRRVLVGLHTKEELLQVIAEEGLTLTPSQLDEDDPEYGQQSGTDEQSEY